MNSFTKTIMVGIGATATVDCFTFLLSHITHKSHGILYIGRWVAYLFKGRIFHDTIIETPSIANELMIGWLTHYSIGIVFAFFLVAIFEKKWLAKPNLLAAMIIANFTLFIPVCILQPALGFGVAFSNLPHPIFLLVKIFLIHLVYGLGLYLTAIVIKKAHNRFQKIPITN